jgi:hypothetical protein
MARSTALCFSDPLSFQAAISTVAVDQRGRNEAGTQSIYFLHVSGTGSDATLRHARFVG